MSLEGMLWALKLSPARRAGISDAAHVTLIAIADYAHPDGRDAYPAASTLAGNRGVDVRTIRRHIKELEEHGLIERGDQALVQHIASNRRPVVWDLRMAVDNSMSGVSDVSPVDEARGDTLWSSGVTPGVLQPPNNPNNSSYVLNSPRAPELSTGNDAVLVDRPQRDCIHGHPAIYYLDRKSRRRLPQCPYCRKIGAITLKPLEPTDA